MRLRGEFSKCRLLTFRTTRLPTGRWKWWWRKCAAATASPTFTACRSRATSSAQSWRSGRPWSRRTWTPRPPTATPSASSPSPSPSATHSSSARLPIASPLRCAPRAHWPLISIHRTRKSYIVKQLLALRMTNAIHFLNGSLWFTNAGKAWIWFLI